MWRLIGVVSHSYARVNVLVGSWHILIVDLHSKYHLRCAWIVCGGERGKSNQLCSVEFQLTNLVTASGLGVVETVRLERWFAIRIERDDVGPFVNRLNHLFKVNGVEVVIRSLELQVVFVKAPLRDRVHIESD